MQASSAAAKVATANRHTTATLLLQLGVPEPVRIAIMGHSSHAPTTTTVYEHVGDEQTRIALSQVATRLQLTS